MESVLITTAVTGSLYAMAAMGLVVTFRASGIFNFAHGAMGMFVAYCYWQFNDQWHIPAVVALTLALGGVAPVMGLVAERIFRPLRSESVVVQVVVSLGMIVFLQNLALILFGRETQRMNALFPTQTFRVGGLRLGYDQIGAVVVALVLAAALTIFLRRTRLGLQMRAVVDNAGLSELAGTSAVRVARIAWGTGVAFAGVGGILLSPFVGLNVNTLTLLVIAAYSAAMLGRLESLPLTVAGGLLLALGENLIVFYAPPGGALVGLRGSLSFLLLFVMLLVHQRRLPRERKPERILLDHAPAPRRWRAGLGLAVAVVLLALPLLLDDNDVFNLNAAMVTTVILLSIVVLTGLSGQVSLCQASFVGIGAFTAGHLAETSGGRFWLALVVAALLAAPVGALVGLPSLRLSGLFLALATMAFALMMDSLVFSIDSLSGGQSGMGVSPPSLAGFDLGSPERFYFLSLGFVVAFGGFVVALKRGRLGRRLQALRDSPEALRTLGVSLAVTRLSVFALSAAMAAMGGVLFGAYRGQVASYDFQMFVSVGYMVSAVIGGVGAVGGALLGGFVHVLPQLTQRAATRPSTFQEYYPLGVALAVIMLSRFPNGVISFAADVVRRRVEVVRLSAPRLPFDAKVDEPVTEPDLQPVETTAS